MILDCTSWIKSKSNEDLFEYECPTCKCELNQDFIDQPLCNLIQLTIASRAWMEMGGNHDEFLLNFALNLGIKCDDQGNIVALEWTEKGLFGALSCKLGALPRLERLYEFYSILLNILRDLRENQLSGSLDDIEGFKNIRNLRSM